MGRKIVELDEELVDQLSEIKQKELITSKGYTQVIRFLVQFYRQAKSIDKIFEQKLNELIKMQESFLKKAERTIDENTKNSIKKLLLSIIQS